ncbi:DUF7848 domain-containing protein [Streptomyces sp. CB02923]|uniref:DUF7848 domain-containing protein n=1 Tax=Streptomyces sp. CB02923 TaxID=1718985 RepID=UPI00093BB067
MSRTVMRYVAHTIRPVPDLRVEARAFCLASGCSQESGLRDDPDEAQDWALRHTGRTGHDLFRRTFSDHARVTRAG